MSNQLGFFDIQDRYEALSRFGDPLENLHKMVPWTTFRKPLKKALNRKKNGLGGRPPYDDILIFKVLVLQALYNLSDDQTKYQIHDRLSFMRFLGLEMDARVPDAKTIWLFCETLAQAGAVEKLFARFDHYLEEQGLMASGGQIIDASIIPVPRQRNKREEELKAQGYCSHIHYKGTRGHPLSKAKQQSNTRRSKVCVRVEHIFGRQHAMDGKFMRSIGINRAKANIGIKNLVYNLQRYVFLAKPAPA